MIRKQLSGKHIGIVFGTFAPMHVGHVDLITKAKRANDNVLVIVSGSNTQEDRGTRAGLSLNRRFRYVRDRRRGRNARLSRSVYCDRAQERQNAFCVRRHCLYGVS